MLIVIYLVDTLDASNLFNPYHPSAAGRLQDVEGRGEFFGHMLICSRDPHSNAVKCCSLVLVAEGGININYVAPPLLLPGRDGFTGLKTKYSLTI